MSVFGDLSQAQRRFMTALFSEISPKRAVSIETAVRVQGKQRQVAFNLERKGLVSTCERGYGYDLRAYLTQEGIEVMNNLDFRHAR